MLTESIEDKILDDIELIKTLEGSKESLIIINERIIEARTIEKNINDMRQK